MCMLIFFKKKRIGISYDYQQWFRIGWPMNRWDWNSLPMMHKSQSLNRIQLLHKMEQTSLARQIRQIDRPLFTGIRIKNSMFNTTYGITHIFRADYSYRNIWYNTDFVPTNTGTSNIFSRVAKKTLVIVDWLWSWSWPGTYIHFGNE